MVLLAALWAADGIELQAYVRKAQALEGRHGHGDKLGVGDGLRRAEDLHAEGAELPHTPGLGLFVSVAGDVVVELYGVAGVIEAVFQHGPHGPRCALRAQGD